MQAVLTDGEVGVWAGYMGMPIGHDAKKRFLRDFEAKVLQQAELLRQCAASGQMSARQLVDTFGDVARQGA